MTKRDAIESRTPLSDFPAEGYVFSARWPIATGDIDSRQMLRLDGAARYIQDVGAQHLFDARVDQVHPHWIVQRTVLDVIEPLTWPNELTFHRWCSGISTRWCSMRVRIEGASGGRMETEGFWINMNKQTQTPSLLDADFFARLATTTEQHRLKWRPWLAGPPLEAAAAIPFALRHTDIDILQHVNNSIYWHGVHEVIARHPDVTASPYRAVVEYRRPITLDETVTIRHHRDGSSVQIWFCVGDDVRAAGWVGALPV